MNCEFFAIVVNKLRGISNFTRMLRDKTGSRSDYAVVPIPHKSKAPVIEKWPELKITENDFLDYFSEDTQQNVGVINGSRSGNLVDIDIDNLAALDLAEAYLPKTGLIFGRKSKPNSHWIYVCDKLPNTTKYNSNDGCVIEIRADGTQSVWPPSVHPSGEAINYLTDGMPAKVLKEELERACRIITVGAILLDNYPAEGARNEFSLMLGSIALRLFNMDIEQAEGFVKAVASLAGDEECDSRSETIKYTAERMKKGEKVLGIPSVEKAIGKEPTGYIAKYVLLDGTAEHEAINELNKEYAFVLMPPQAQIIKEMEDKNGHKDFVFLQIGAFKHMLGSCWLKEKKLATVWLESPFRRTYTGIEFSPTTPTPGKYNLWQGYPINPIQGDCRRYLAHIRNIICGGNDEYTHYFIAWLSNIIRDPERKPGTAIVIRGKQGTGKSFVFKHFGKLLGKHYKVADNERYISGRFNSHLHDCLLLHLEEAFFAGDKKLEASLKEMITGDEVLMEYKGKEPVLAKNYARVAITTNATWVIPAGFEERRFFVIDAQEDEMQKKAYFAAIAKELENGGYEALMDYLMRYEYDPNLLRDVPKTEALLEQKLHSLNHEEQWWLETLRKGELPLQNGWTGICGTGDMFENYVEHTKISGARFKSAQTRLGMFLKKMVPDIEKRTGSYQTKRFSMSSDLYTEKGTYYVFPDLDVCRKAFELRLGQKFDWEKW